MKKNLLCTMAIGAIMTLMLPSCKKASTSSLNANAVIVTDNSSTSNAKTNSDGVYLNANSPEVTFLKGIPSIAAFLNSNQINGFNERFKRNIDNSNWSVFDLSSDLIGDKKFNLLCLTNSNKKIVLPYSAETTFSNGRPIKIIIRSVLDNNIITSATLDTITGNVDSPPCSSQGLGFTDCFQCAMHEITNDLLGTIACSVNPLSCIIASAFSCSVLNSSVRLLIETNGNNGVGYISSHNEIESFVNVMLEQKVATQMVKYGDIYILN